MPYAYALVRSCGENARLHFSFPGLAVPDIAHTHFLIIPLARRQALRSADAKLFLKKYV